METREGGGEGWGGEEGGESRKLYLNNSKNQRYLIKKRNESENHNIHFF